MNYLNIHRSTLVFFILIIIPLADSRLFSTEKNLRSTSKSNGYKRMAKYCYIDDYPGWLQRQQELMIWFDLAKMLQLPIDEDIEFQRELKQYRLQYECLRIVERLPLAIGPG